MWTLWMPAVIVALLMIGFLIYFLDRPDLVVASDRYVQGISGGRQSPGFVGAGWGVVWSGGGVAGRRGTGLGLDEGVDLLGVRDSVVTSFMPPA